jgi:hypothetical protein
VKQPEPQDVKAAFGALEKACDADPGNIALGLSLVIFRKLAAYYVDAVKQLELKKSRGNDARATWWRRWSPIFLCIIGVAYLSPWYSADRAEWYTSIGRAIAGGFVLAGGIALIALGRLSPPK